MKIVFISLGFDPVRLSGADIIAERLVQGLLQAGHAVTVVAGSRGDFVERPERPGLDILRLPIGPTDWIGYSLRAGRLVNRLPAVDIIHFWDVHFAYACRRPFLATVHHSFHQRLGSISDHDLFTFSGVRQRLYYQLARLVAETPAARRATGLLAVSETTRQEFIRTYGAPPEKIILTREGVDSDFFSPVPDTRVLRDRLGLPSDSPVLLFAGFITPRKGIEVIAQALHRLPPTTVLLLAGTWRNEAYRASVMDLFGDARQRVIETGFVPDSEMPALYSLADLYVSSSLMEGFGLPLAESLACGTPVIAAEAGAVSEVVGPGGILVPSRDPVALAEAINHLLADPGQRAEMGLSGREHIRNNFSQARMVRDVLDAYERLSRRF
jgi:MMP alpha-(1->4)-mannosyltransferase